MAQDLTPFKLLYYIGLAVVFANVTDLTISWFDRKAEKLKSAKGKDAKIEKELDEIHRIIRRKGKTAKYMTVMELAKELRRNFEAEDSIWSELLYSGSDWIVPDRFDRGLLGWKTF